MDLTMIIIFSKKVLEKYWENTEKYMFSFDGKKVARIDGSGEDSTKNMSYRLRFVDSARFMANSLSNLVNNFAEKIHNIKCKYGHDDKKCENCRIKYKNCQCCLEYINVIDDLVEYKCLCCNKNYQ